jgi:hypothetical protein
LVLRLCSRHVAERTCASKVVDYLFGYQDIAGNLGAAIVYSDGGQSVPPKKGTIMTKYESLRPSRDVDGARPRSDMSFADAHLGQLFYALLDDEGMEEVMGDFLAPAGQTAPRMAVSVRSAQRPAARRELTRAAAALSARRALNH